MDQLSNFIKKYEQSSIEKIKSWVSILLLASLGGYLLWLSYTDYIMENSNQEDVYLYLVIGMLFIIGALFMLTLRRKYPFFNIQLYENGFRLMGGALKDSKEFYFCRLEEVIFKDGEPGMALRNNSSEEWIKIIPQIKSYSEFIPEFITLYVENRLSFILEELENSRTIDFKYIPANKNLGASLENAIKKFSNAKTFTVDKEKFCFEGNDYYWEKIDSISSDGKIFTLYNQSGQKIFSFPENNIASIYVFLSLIDYKIKM